MKHLPFIVSAVILLTLSGVQATCQSSAVKNVPNPGTTNNYYYSGNWYYGQRGPVPRKSLEQHRGGSDTEANSAEAQSSPIEAKSNQQESASIASEHEQEPESVSVRGPVGIQRDWYDKALIFFNGLLVLIIAIQSRLLYRTYIAQYRPLIHIKQVILLNDPKAELIGVPIKVRVFLVNRGANKAKIVEGNVTLQFITHGRFAALVEYYASGGTPVKMAMPPPDIEAGIPLYSEDRSVLAGQKLEAGKTQMIEQSITGAPDDPLPHLAIADLNSSVVFYAFGYFTYGNRIRQYTTFFCRRYDRRERRFMKVDDPDYEYSD